MLQTELAPLEKPTRWTLRQSWSVAMENMPEGVTREPQESKLYTKNRAGKLIYFEPRETARTVLQGRKEADDIIHKRDDRLLVFIGPCSIHDTDAAQEYAVKLKSLADRVSGDLCIIMRAYLEKPRSTVGWKGLINDPNLDGTKQINKGLRVSRRLYADLTSIGMPIGTEMLDTISPTYLSDFVSLGAIGARTTESQTHRELASAMPFPVGFKNSTDGDIGVAVDSLTSAASGHTFTGVTDSGVMRIVQSRGNQDCFVILRGGRRGPNYGSEHIEQAEKLLEKSGHDSAIMVDCSHGNSNKDWQRQSDVAREVGEQVSAGHDGIIGVMIESNLVEGKQANHSQGSTALKRGVSITDGCIGWEATVECVEQLAEAVRKRRAAIQALLMR